eukprot:jgi/Hompol1/645/HPOL_000990-RA
MAAPTLVTYALCAAYGAHAWTPVVVFVAVMAHLAYIQLCAQLWFPGDFVRFPDISAPMMVLTIKLTSFAWSTLNPEMRPFAITKMPDLLEFCGFVFFFPCVWAGPSFDYVYYYEYVRGIGPYSKIPSTASATIRVLALGFALLAVFAVLDSQIGPRFMRNEFLSISMPFWKRLLIIQLAGFSTRAKLSSAWKIAEAAGIMCGLGYNGLDHRTNAPLFNRIENVNVRGVELGQSPKACIDNWNIKTSNWLKRCVYLRLTDTKSKSTLLATVLTNLTSAFWHGFHPGYYLSFLSATFLIITGRTMRRFCLPFFVRVGSPLIPYKPVYDALGTFFTMGILNCFFVTFIVQRADVSINIWASIYFIAHVCVIVPIIALDYLGGGKYLTRQLRIMVGDGSSEQERVKKDQ